MEERIFIKTEEEMIQEHGTNWKYDITPRWNSGNQMDHLYGVDITDEMERQFNSNNMQTLKSWIRGETQGAHSFRVRDESGQDWNILTKHCRVGYPVIDNTIYKVKTNGLFA